MRPFKTALVLTSVLGIAGAALAATPPKTGIASFAQLKTPLPYPYDEQADADAAVARARAEARKHGAGDRDIHDTVLIAATFSMFNRYVDGLASLTPTDPKAYEEMGKRMSAIGYVMPKPALR